MTKRSSLDQKPSKAELEKQSADRERSESEWREQLDTAWVMKKQMEGAWAGAVERNKRFEEELTGLRQERDELNSKLTTEQQAAADSRQRAKEVESRLSRNATEFGRAKAEQEKQSAEREHSEAEWREELNNAKARKEKLEKALAEAMERNQRLAEELASQLEMHKSGSELFLLLLLMKCAQCSRVLEQVLLNDVAVCSTPCKNQSEMK